MKGKKKSAAKTEGEGECFAAGPLRASGHIRTIQPWFAGLVPLDSRFFRRVVSTANLKSYAQLCATPVALDSCRVHRRCAESA
jgi:hypothetical protein